MTLTVLLFAHLRDRFGPSVTVELPAGATVADLRAVLPLDGCRVAVNLQFADDADVIAPGDEVAAIPPVSGG